MRSRVERAPMNFSAVRANQLLGASEHFLSGAPCERQEKNPIGPNTALDKMRYAVNERPGFPGACACNNEKGTVTVSRGCGLFRVELRGQITRRARLDHSLPCRVNSRCRRLSHRSQYTLGARKIPESFR